MTIAGSLDNFQLHVTWSICVNRTYSGGPISNINSATGADEAGLALLWASRCLVEAREETSPLCFTIRSAWIRNMASNASTDNPELACDAAHDASEDWIVCTAAGALSPKSW